MHLLHKYSLTLYSMAFPKPWTFLCLVQSGFSHLWFFLVAFLCFHIFNLCELVRHCFPSGTSGNNSKKPGIWLLSSWLERGSGETWLRTPQTVLKKEHWTEQCRLTFRTEITSIKCLKSLHRASSKKPWLTCQQVGEQDACSFQRRELTEHSSMGGMLTLGPAEPSTTNTKHLSARFSCFCHLEWSPTCNASDQWDFVLTCFPTGHGADVKCVDWHPTKGLVVSGSKDSQQPIKFWDPKTGQSLATL